MSLHAPSKGWFIASLIIAVIALIVRCRQFQFHTSLRMEFGLPWLGLDEGEGIPQGDLEHI